VIVEGVSSTHKHDNEESILSFEFPINYKDLQNYLTISYSNAEDNIKVWLNGRVNLKTGEVISSNLGRLSSSQAANGWSIGHLIEDEIKWILYLLSKIGNTSVILHYYQQAAPKKHLLIF
jgi:hypothetical protein